MLSLSTALSTKQRFLEQALKQSQSRTQGAKDGRARTKAGASQENNSKKTSSVPGPFESFGRFGPDEVFRRYRFLPDTIMYILREKILVTSYVRQTEIRRCPHCSSCWFALDFWPLARCTYWSRI